MPKHLVRYQNIGQFHFLTISCYRREPLFKSKQACMTFEQELESVRRRYGKACYYNFKIHTHRKGHSLLRQDDETWTTRRSLLTRIAGTVRHERESYSF